LGGLGHVSLAGRALVWERRRRGGGKRRSIHCCFFVKYYNLFLEP
jgi:hypothetical protein